MDHFQPAVDPRKQELLEARFLGARVSFVLFALLKIICERNPKKNSSGTPRTTLDGGKF